MDGIRLASKLAAQIELGTWDDTAELFAIHGHDRTETGHELVAAALTIANS